MPNALDAFDLADTIFVDANIFVFHAFADPRRGNAARRFLERVELAQVNAVTSVLVENEVIFKILLQEAAGHLDNPAVWNARRALRDDPTFREQVYRPARRYLDYLGMLASRGLTLVDVTVDQTRQAIDLGCQLGLLITDATHVATCHAHKIFHVATGDEDLWHLAGVTAWAP